MTTRSRVCALTLTALLTGATAVEAQLAGSIERPNVFGPALEGNLMGESDSPEATIYLPPGYGTETDRRYPVVYFLHGYGLPDQGYMGPGGPFELAEAADRSFLEGKAREMIIVTPNAYNRYGGSMYSSSVTTGDWETYIAEDLVAYVDTNFRTLASRESRGLSGHSMGGYGTLRIGMKRPDVFSSLYNMSACCLRNNQGAARGGGFTPEQAEQPEGGRGQAGRGGRGRGGGGTTPALAAAWAPNPDNPPDYFDLPVADGERQAHVDALFQANSPLVMVPQYIANLKKYEAIAGDVGLGDGLASTNVELAGMLEAFGVAYRFETYDGNHTNRVAERFEDIVLPFFSDLLEFED
jgi:enterochelin esterase-like enzyme